MIPKYSELLWYILSKAVNKINIVDHYGLFGITFQ